MTLHGTEFVRLFLGTIFYRPYVYGFFICFLFFAIKQLRARGTTVYLGVAYLVAYASEYNSTHQGFPFGLYVYLDETRTRELWLANIPFWDSLSFVFLSYFSWIAASSLIDPRNLNRALLKTRTAILGGFLMMVLDLIIDPVTLLGDRWFLGKIYYYPSGGQYFGVTLTNFAGWWFVGTTTLLIIQFLARRNYLGVIAWRNFNRQEALYVWCVYVGVMIFNLAITAWIGAWSLFLSSLVIALLILSICLRRYFTFKIRSVPEAITP